MLVSVVMPVLDGEPWLGEAIESILTQTHQQLELIIVDDGSTDGSRDLAAAFARRDRRVRILGLPRDAGSTSSARAANAGVAAAAGALIARMDHDDIALPGRLAAQVAFLKRSGLDGCGGLAEAFGSEERLFWFPESPEGLDRELIFRVGLLHPTMVVRTEVLRRHPYNIAATHEDYEWQVRARAAGVRLGNLQEVVLRHRTHAGQANRLHRPLFLRDLRRYRFGHAMRLFPGTKAQEYQALAWLAEGAPLRGEEELARVRQWLVRLACHPDAQLRAAMARRWDKACDRTNPAPEQSVRDAGRAEILAAR